MKNKKHNITVRVLLVALLTMLMGCGGGTVQKTAESGMVTNETVSETDADLKTSEKVKERVELVVLAAASLTDVCTEIEAEYEALHDNVDLIFSYGSSGALQTQIEEGAPADVFLSAAKKQMTALDEQGLMDTSSIIELLENKVVLIVPKGREAGLTCFEDAATDQVSMIGLGELGSVPVGQYAEEVFTTLGIWDEVQKKANYGSDVRTVLSWVETGAVECGVVYATDAYTTEAVEIVCEAPQGSCRQVLYPAGIVKASANKEEAERFLEYLQEEESMELFEAYGFSRVN